MLGVDEGRFKCNPRVALVQHCTFEVRFWRGVEGVTSEGGELLALEADISRVLMDL
jgi:hypothetical protein